MNKYCKMMEHVHMPEEQHRQLREQLMERTGNRGVRPIWQRYAVAAALALCLMGTAVTAYAAVHYQWFDVFFDNGNTNIDIMEEMTAKASTEEVTAQDKNYKFTVRHHLYSKEQQMGLIICSFQFLEEDQTYLNVWSKEQNGVILKKGGMIDGQEFMEKCKDRSQRQLNFHIGDESQQQMIFSELSYLADENVTEDGEYMIGIRYSFRMENAGGEVSNLILSLENAGDVEGNLKARLPKSQEIESVCFASETNPKDVFVISPIGMTFTMTVDKADHPENTFDHEIMDSFKMVMDHGTKTNADMAGDYETSVLQEETEMSSTWCLQRGFTELVDTSKIDHIELDGEKFTVR